MQPTTIEAVNGSKWEPILRQVLPDLKLEITEAHHAYLGMRKFLLVVETNDEQLPITAIFGTYRVYGDCFRLDWVLSCKTLGCLDYILSPKFKYNRRMSEAICTDYYLPPYSYKNHDQHSFDCMKSNLIWNGALSTILPNVPDPFDHIESLEHKKAAIRGWSAILLTKSDCPRFLWFRASTSWMELKRIEMVCFSRTRTCFLECTSNEFLEDFGLTEQP